MRLVNAVHNNSLYFCTVFVQMQDNLMHLGRFLAIPYVSHTYPLRIL